MNSTNSNSLANMHKYISNNFPIGTNVSVERFREPELTGLVVGILQDKVLVRAPKKYKKHIYYTDLLIITKK